MKRYKWGILTIILVILITCIGMIIRINVLFPNAKVITYTSDNPADLDGLIIKPVNYKVYTMEEYSEISSRYKNIQGEKADKSRVVVLNILLKNTTEDIITYYPSGNMVIEKLHARNGVTLYGTRQDDCNSYARRGTGSWLTCVYWTKSVGL